MLFLMSFMTDDFGVFERADKRKGVFKAGSVYNARGIFPSRGPYITTIALMRVFHLRFSSFSCLYAFIHFF